MKNKGFTLIELLVVIAITAVLLAVAVPNYLDARNRAKDAKVKQELTQLKTAMRLYYNDRQQYPYTNTGTQLIGCGVSYTATCPPPSSEYGTTCMTAFIGGGVSNDCASATVYMNRMPSFGSVWVSADRDAYIIKSVLNNRSDPELAEAASRCNVLKTGYCTASQGEYCICSE